MGHLGELRVRMRHVTEPNHHGMNAYCSSYKTFHITLRGIYERSATSSGRILPRYTTNRWLGGPQAPFGRFGETSRPLLRTELRLSSRCHALFVFLVSLGGVRLSPLGTSATVDLLYRPRMIDNDYGAVGGMRIGRGNRSTRRKPAPVPLRPPQIPHDLTWN
jgi:hypothetical protein